MMTMARPLPPRRASTAGPDAQLAAARRSQEALTQQMDASRRVIEELFATERAETALYVQDTHLQMQAIRQVLALEVDRAREDIDTALQEAQGTLGRRHEELRRTQWELLQRRHQLDELRSQREEQQREALASIRAEAQRNAEQLRAEIRVTEGIRTPPSPPPDPTPSPLVIPLHMDATDTPLSNATTPTIDTEDTRLPVPSPVHSWLAPFAVSLVMMALFWGVYVRYRSKARAAKRQRRVLYSEQLRSHFANGGGPTASERRPRPRPSAMERRPTLHYRTRATMLPPALATPMD